MSPPCSTVAVSSEGVPRASGDEPSDWALFQILTECSPRERG